MHLHQSRYALFAGVALVTSPPIFFQAWAQEPSPEPRPPVAGENEENEEEQAGDLETIKDLLASLENKRVNFVYEGEANTSLLLEDGRFSEVLTAVLSGGNRLRWSTTHVGKYKTLPEAPAADSTPATDEPAADAGEMVVKEVVLTKVCELSERASTGKLEGLCHVESTTADLLAGQAEQLLVTVESGDKVSVTAKSVGYLDCLAQAPEQEGEEPQPEDAETLNPAAQNPLQPCAVDVVSTFSKDADEWEHSKTESVTYLDPESLEPVSGQEAAVFKLKGSAAEEEEGGSAQPESREERSGN